MEKARLRYEDTLKADEVEEWIAKRFLRPIAFRIVVLLYETKIHSVHVTFTFLLVGIFASWLITMGTSSSLISAAICVQVKSILDAVDGQLARARNSPSRVGRFFDSAADFITTFTFIMACAFLLYERTGKTSFLYTGVAVVLLSEIQNSFWVFYNFSYRNLVGGRTVSVLEESHSVTVYPYDEDKRGILAFLRSFYRITFGWQDSIIALLDRTSRKVVKADERYTVAWYSNLGFLRASGVLGLGSHLFIMSISLVLNRPSYYFVFTLYIANVYLVALILYHMVTFTFARRNRNIS